MSVEVPQNGPAIKDFRIKEGRTQENVASQIGMTKTWLSHIESERHPATDLALVDLARALGISPAAIVRDRDHGKQLIEQTPQARVRRAS